MGIPSYFSNIIKRYPGIIQKYNPSLIVNQLFMDCNSIIYDSFHNISKDCDMKSQVYIEEQIIKEVIKKINNYIKTIGGKKLNYLAFDGVAPVAKMEQQKTRRFKSSYEKNLNSKESIDWDTSAITPGTIFMKKLERELNKTYNKVNNVIIAFSDPGEGEHKIFDYIRKNSILSGNSIIYGLDSDLIMLSLQNNNHCEHLYLYREMPEFIESIDKSLIPNDIYMIDIEMFKKKLALYLNNEKDNMNKDEELCRIQDYIFICFLLGNDFLPHFPSLNLRRNGMDFLLECYIYAIGKNKSFIIHNNKINWKVFRNMIIEMAKHEDEYVNEEYIYRNKLGKRYFPQNTEEDKKKWFINQPIIFREKELYINPSYENWEKRYYYSLFNINSNELSFENYNNNIENICKNYLEGLEWTYNYYSKGCIDWRWYYKYHYPPLLKDLKNYIPYFDESFLKKKEKNPVSDIIQLSYVLPINEKIWRNILHSQVYDKLISAYKSFNEKYNVNNLIKTEFEWTYCRYFWECHVIFDNYPSVIELENIINV